MFSFNGPISAEPEAGLPALAGPAAGRECTAGIVEEMRTLAGRPNLSETQKEAFRDITAERDRHVSRQQRKEARQLSQRLGGGRGM